MTTSRTIIGILSPLVLIGCQAHLEMTDHVSSTGKMPETENATQQQQEIQETGETAGGTIYVDQNVEKEGNGKSWQTAYRHLQPALDAAARTGAEVWIAPGTYFPEGENRSQCFSIEDGVRVYGSMFPGAPDKSVQDTVRTPTILSGNIGDPSRANDNCYHVVSVGIDVVLDSIVIQDGFADGPVPDNEGGAIRLKHSKPAEPFHLTLSRIIFRDNFAEQGGALFLSEPGKADISATYFRTNSALYGGAIMIMGGELNFNNVHFFANSATFDAGAFSLGDGVRATLLSCLFTNNTAGGSGGAIQLRNILQTKRENVIDIDDTLFTGNRAEKLGGAIHNSGSSILTVKNSHLHDNRAPKGGDTATTDNAQSIVQKCVFIEGRKDSYVEEKERL